MKQVCLALLCLIISLCSMAQKKVKKATPAVQVEENINREEPAAAPQTVKLEEGTTLRLSLKEELNSKTAQAGDFVELEMIDDVEVDGDIVIKSGTPVKGEITEASKAKMLGKGGKLDFTVNFTKSVDGQNIRLRSSRTYSGKNKTGGVIAAAAIINPLFLLLKGKNITLKKGQNFSAYVDKDYLIKIKIAGN